MDIGRCHGIAPDKSMFHIDTDIVLVAVVIDAVLFNPSRIQVLLPQSIWVFVPTFRHAILFDLLVVFSAIPLLLLFFEKASPTQKLLARGTGTSVASMI